MRFLLLAFVLIMTGSAHADPGIFQPGIFQYDKRQVPAPTSLEAFLIDAWGALPPQAQKALRRPIQIRFVGKSTEPLVPPPCRSEVGTERGEQSGGHIYGRLVSPTVVELNAAFLPEIEKGAQGARAYPCGHRSLYTLAKATLLHELMHAYDGLNLPAKNNPVERELRAHCRQQADQKGGVKDPRCGRLEFLRTSVSTRPAFLTVMKWSQSWDGYRGKNEALLRSPDPYESFNPAESFAVNAEFFFLDPEFACRRPAVHAMLSREFDGFDPFPNRPCRVNTQIHLSSSGKTVDLNPERIYQVHYLIADRGEALMSRWGHSMIRLIVCAPKRALGPECLKDTGHHVVLSYRAGISGATISHWKGLFGGYPSKLFALSFLDVLNEYTVGEGRDLRSVPLALDRQELKDALSFLLEQYWGYAGAYAFAGNNCSTETLAFLSTLHSSNGYGHGDGTRFRSPWIVTPQRVARALDQMDLADSELRSEFFKSFSKSLEDSYQRVSRWDIQVRTVREYIESSRADERWESFLRAKASVADVKELQKLALHFYTLESKIRERLQERIGLRVSESLEKKYRLGSDSFRASVDRIQEIDTRLSPFTVAEAAGLDRYGIPLAGETLAEVEIQRLIQEKSRLSQRLVEESREAFVDLVSDREAIAHNIQEFLREVGISVRKVNSSADTSPSEQKSSVQSPN